jgi:kynurenine formamidase
VVIDLNNYRVVDLSYELVPGERLINGEYRPGEPWYGRTLELQEFVFSTARMHFLQAQTHLGTHTEAPYKYQDGPDVAGTDLSSYMGEAAVCDFSAKAGGEAITGPDFERAGVQHGDIVLVRTGKDLGDARPVMTVEAIDWLLSQEIRLLGSGGNVLYGPDVDGHLAAERRLLAAGIPLVDGLYRLDQLTASRVFFMALPLRIQRLTASWTRAIALEPRT